MLKVITKEIRLQCTLKFIWRPAKEEYWPQKNFPPKHVQITSWFLKLYSPVFCGSEIKCGLMLSEKGCRGLAANLTSKPRRFKAFWRTNLGCSALIVIISCPTILLCKACWESGRAKQGRCFRNFLPCPQPVHLLCIHCWVEPSVLLCSNISILNRKYWSRGWGLQSFVMQELAEWRR